MKKSEFGEFTQRDAQGNLTNGALMNDLLGDEPDVSWTSRIGVKALGFTDAEIDLMYGPAKGIADEGTEKADMNTAQLPADPGYGNAVADEEAWRTWEFTPGTLEDNGDDEEILDDSDYPPGTPGVDGGSS